jgi:bifunctional non-homologous end joining protein LigD
MKATLGPLPEGDDWAFELKWDGMRLQATVSAGAQGRSGGTEPEPALTLRSLSGRDVTASFPELAPLAPKLAVSAVLDGEAVVFDADRPSFGRLQHRMHVADPPPSLVAQHPTVYVVFDLLVLEGRSLLDLPYRTRRAVLSDLLDDGPTWRVPPSVEGDGGQLLALAEARGLEGIVAKKLNSRYQPGTRSSEWLKVKVRKRQELVVVGWLAGQGRLTGEIGSLLLGVWEQGALRFAGAAGSGLGQRERDQLRPLLVDRQTCPLAKVPPLDRPPHWVEPTVVAEIEYGWWPADGLLRHPVYCGLLPDHDPAEVVRELPPDGQRVR